MTAVAVVEAVRTPFGRRGGGLSSAHPADLLAGVLSALVERSGVSPETVGAVVAGCAEKAGEQGFNIPRTAWLAAGLPPSVPALTVDAQCGSSQEAVTLAHAMIAAGQSEIVIACGVESMSRVPIGHTFSSGPGHPIPDSYRERYAEPDQFAAAELIAERYGVTREACDLLAATSNQRAAAAWRLGAFDGQIVRVNELATDECVRDTSIEQLGRLEELAPGAVHTRATASKVADGAAAVLLAHPAAAMRYGLPVMATILDSVLVGVEPDMMLSGPHEVTPRLLERNGMTVGEIDHWEVNEAFASVVVSWASLAGVDTARVNPLGGAIAHGHPIGATGAALITKAAHALSGGGAETAVVAMCCGGALGTGTLLRAGSVAAES